MGAVASDVAWTVSNGTRGGGGVGVGSAGGVDPFSLGDKTILSCFVIDFFFRHHLRSLPLQPFQRQFFPLWGG